MPLMQKWLQQPLIRGAYGGGSAVTFAAPPGGATSYSAANLAGTANLALR